MSTKRRRRHSPEQIVRKSREADAMLTPGRIWRRCCSPRRGWPWQESGVAPAYYLIKSRSINPAARIERRLLNRCLQLGALGTKSKKASATCADASIVSKCV